MTAVLHVEAALLVVGRSQYYSLLVTVRCCSTAVCFDDDGTVEEQ